MNRIRTFPWNISREPENCYVLFFYFVYEPLNREFQRFREENQMERKFTILKFWSTLEVIHSTGNSGGKMAIPFVLEISGNVNRFLIFVECKAP